jgi:hypothetical protein
MPLNHEFLVLAARSGRRRVRKRQLGALVVAEWRILEHNAGMLVSVIYGV